MIKSLEGIWSDEYLFMLKQAYEEYHFYQKQIKDCDKKIQEQLLKQVSVLPHRSGVLKSKMTRMVWCALAG